MRVVIYLITSPLSKRNYNRFGIQRWLDRGWEVKVFDFTKFLKSEIYTNPSSCINNTTLR